MRYYVRVPKKRYSSGTTSPQQQPAVTELLPSNNEDSEGLLKRGYDVILCGTGLVQSILASSLTLAGYSILQCDHAGNYGEDSSAAMHLDQFLALGDLTDEGDTEGNESDGGPDGDADAGELRLNGKGGVSSLMVHSSSTTDTTLTLRIGTRVRTPYGDGVIHSTTNNNDHASSSHTSYSVQFTNWGAVCHGLSPQQLTPLLTHYRHSILSQSRKFALDFTPHIINGDGPATRGLISSNVSDYLEFKALETLRMVGEDGLMTVPCSRGEVFKTKGLSALEKRKLMRLIQLAFDYGEGEGAATGGASASNTSAEGSPSSEANPDTTQTTAHVQSTNERRVQPQGMSLLRPQNKPINTSISNTSQTFQSYLENKPHKLSNRLSRIVRYALALSTEENITVAEGLRSMYRHVKGLGRFEQAIGGTAFLCPLYGSGEIGQAFCRNCAVYGGIYLLRRCPRAITIDRTENGCVAKDVLIAGYQPDKDDVFGGDPGDVSIEKRIPCKVAVVIPGDSLPSASTSSVTRLVRRISILRTAESNGSCLGTSSQLIVIPPRSGTIQNTNVIHVLVQDSSLMVCPPGYFLVHFTTTATCCSSSDSSTRTVDTNSDLEDAIASLQNAADSLFLSSPTEEDTPMELYHRTYSVAIGGVSDGTTPNDGSPLPSNVHVIPRPKQSVTSVDEAFETANVLFRTIVSNDGRNDLEFLKMSQTVRDKFAALRRDYNVSECDDPNEDDMEQSALDSALEMMSPS